MPEMDTTLPGWRRARRSASSASRPIKSAGRVGSGLILGGGAGFSVSSQVRIARNPSGWLVRRSKYFLLRRGAEAGNLAKQARKLAIAIQDPGQLTSTIVGLLPKGIGPFLFDP